MPWPEKQRRAIFLRIKRTKGEAAAKRFMHEHGYGQQDVAREALDRIRKQRRRRAP